MTALTPDAIAKILGDCETGCTMQGDVGSRLPVTLRDVLTDYIILRNGPMKNSAADNSASMILLCLVGDLAKRLKEQDATFS